MIEQLLLQIYVHFLAMFNQFLANIKRLNDHAQSREETIRMAQEIFGGENEDLFSSFKALLSKHGLS
jgi:hypothetical protein